MHFTWVSMYLALKVLIVDTILRLLLETEPPFYIAWSSEPREGLGWQPSSTEWINPAATSYSSVNFRPFFVTLFTFTFFQDRKPLLVTVAVDGKSYNFKHRFVDMENGDSSHAKRKFSIHERKRKQSLAARLKPLFAKKRRKESKGGLKLMKQRFRSEKGVHYLDQYSRILFPLGYIAFLTTYFVIYMA